MTGPPTSSSASFADGQSNDQPLVLSSDNGNEARSPPAAGPVAQPSHQPPRGRVPILTTPASSRIPTNTHDGLTFVADRAGPSEQGPPPPVNGHYQTVRNAPRQDAGGTHPMESIAVSPFPPTTSQRSNASTNQSRSASKRVVPPNDETRQSKRHHSSNRDPPVARQTHKAPTVRSIRRPGPIDRRYPFHNASSHDPLPPEVYINMYDPGQQIPTPDVRHSTPSTQDALRIGPKRSGLLDAVVAPKYQSHCDCPDARMLTRVMRVVEDYGRRDQNVGEKQSENDDSLYTRITDEASLVLTGDAEPRRETGFRPVDHSRQLAEDTHQPSEPHPLETGFRLDPPTRERRRHDPASHRTIKIESPVQQPGIKVENDFDTPRSKREDTINTSRVNHEDELDTSRVKHEGRINVSDIDLAASSGVKPEEPVVKPEIKPEHHTSPTRPAQSAATPSSVWPRHMKGTVALAAEKWLAAQPENFNTGFTISKEEILSILDQNPSYVQLCKMIQKTGVKFELSSLAKAMLKALPKGPRNPRAEKGVAQL